MHNKVCNDYGIDYEKGVAHCMGDEELFMEILAMFLEDSSFGRAKAAYESKDYEVLLKSVHELKGVSGNAALTELYKTTCELVEYLRNGKINDEDVNMLFALMAVAYNRTRDGIALTLAE